jgi:hypothetical protein
MTGPGELELQTWESRKLLLYPNSAKATPQRGSAEWARRAQDIAESARRERQPVCEEK